MLLIGRFPNSESVGSVQLSQAHFLYLTALRSRVPRMFAQSY
jgi:hypothetical protein